MSHLRCGDQDCSEQLVGPQGLHGGDVLVGRAWWCVHNEEVQVPPGHVGDKLFNQSCEIKGTDKKTQTTTGFSKWLGAVGQGPGRVDKAVCQHNIALSSSE